MAVNGLLAKILNAEALTVRDDDDLPGVYSWAFGIFASIVSGCQAQEKEVKL